MDNLVQRGQPQVELKNKFVGGALSGDFVHHHHAEGGVCFGFEGAEEFDEHCEFMFG